METITLMFVMFLFGGTSLTLYALCVADAHDKSTLSRTEISALLLLLNGAGSMIGPIMTGAMTTFTGDALFLVAALSMSGLLLLMSGNHFYGGARSMVTRAYYYSIPDGTLKLNGVDGSVAGLLPGADLLPPVVMGTGNR